MFVEHTVILSEGGVPTRTLQRGIPERRIDLGFAVKTYWTYILDILTNVSCKTLYTGVTSTIVGRSWQHKNKVFSGFASRYRVNRLVYFEAFSRIDDAIAREKEIKGWIRAKKIALIQSINPKWDDLSRHWQDVFKPDKT